MQLNSIFPLPAFWSLENNDQEQFTQHFIKFYKHCTFYNDSENNRNYHLISKHDMDVRRICLPYGQHSQFLFLNVLIKSYLSVDTPRSKKQKWKFTLKINNIKCKKKFTLIADRIIQLRLLPFPFSNGNEIELITFPRAFEAPLDIEKWDHWKRKMKSSICNYRETIYPIFHLAMQASCSYFQHKLFSVLDIGGGDGELAMHLLKQCSHIQSYTLVDANQQSTDLATQRASCDCSFYGERRKLLKVINADLTKENLIELVGEKAADIIIFCGVLAHQVLSREDSQKLLLSSKKLLNDNGIIFVASHSHPYFSSKDFNKMGFEVWNKTGIYCREKAFYAEPFYALRLFNTNDG